MSNKKLYEKSFAKALIFGMLTFGIYSFWLGYAYHRDTDILCAGDGKEGPSFFMVWLLSMITFSIYSFIWTYNNGNRVQDNADRYGIKIREDGTILLIWTIVFPILALYFMINNHNEMIKVYNARLDDNEYDELVAYAPPPVYIK